mmetsp:Transcript_23116/g.35431  ORF Transcript_23116/g.35431 Transcript_23116/m.35431 type:complete len:819 (+) Transcript_23116:1-2457(+)
MHDLLEENIGRGLMIASRPVPSKPLSDERMAEIENLKTFAMPFPEKRANTVESNVVTICAPLESKGIKGSDQRCYLLDITRLTPRDANWVSKEHGGTGKWEEESEKSGKAKAIIPSSLDDKEWTMAVLRPELITNFTQTKMLKHLEEKKKRLLKEANIKQENAKEEDKPESEAKETEVDSNDVKLNVEKKAATESQGIEEMEKLKKVLDSEDSTYMQSLRLNVNVFLPNTRSLETLDKDAYKQVLEDEEHVREASVYLWDEVLPKLTKEMRENSGHQMPSDGKTLTELLHQKGINCRYLGRLATLAVQEEANDQKAERDAENGETPRLPRRIMPLCWLELLECEMVTRAAKHVLDAYFTEHGGAASLLASETIASFLSALVSTGEETAADTEHRLEKAKKNGTHDESYFNSLAIANVGGGTPGTRPSRGRSAIWNDIEKEVGRRFRYKLTLYNNNKKRSPTVPLLRRVCQRSGVRMVARDYQFGGKCLCSSNTSGNIGSSYPITALDILDVAPLVKHAAAHAGEGFMPCFAGATVGPPSLHILLNDAKTTLEIAHVHWNSRNLPHALDMAQEAASIYQRVIDSPLHPTVARCLDLTAIILFEANEAELAAANASRALGLAVQLGGFDSADALSAHLTLSHILINSGRMAAGVKHLRTVVYLMELMGGPHSSELSHVYHKLGSVYHEMGNVPAALQFYEEAESRTCNDRMVQGMIAKSKALGWASLFQFRSAVESEKRAFTVYKRVLGENHEITKNSTTTLKEFTKLAVEQGTRLFEEEKKRKEQEAADAIAFEIEKEDEEEKKKKQQSKNKKKKNNKK